MKNILSDLIEQKLWGCRTQVETSWITRPCSRAKYCGVPASVEGATHYHGIPGLMAGHALFARDMGTKIIGGCCGTSPAHVAAITAALAVKPKRPIDEAAMTAALGTA